ncbi:spore protease YyaC [Clostridium estertheticum]|uniref:spore protease YyaC n=1 Tax=Clostridium estertheticum TaxID=238834 RepID=UPI001C7D8950|nr:spore protease YyaC [Clostridium estertheticum]MBX4267035.1 spore protease YyaC [Clostridium estertheticum]WLC90879.1 spore protease YyaC [Clostridium estertheticum]
MMDKIVLDSMSRDCTFKLRDIISQYIFPIVKSSRPIVVLCIGTDRSTGDSLGPLVGNKLNFLIRNKIHIYGNLECPVHAKNLCETIDEINYTYTNPYIIAIDACLGSLQSVGKIVVEEKPLSPGAAMNKDLPKVGDLSITGIVNISGAFEFMVLQNTRLYTVMILADAISKGLYHSVLKTIGGIKLNSLYDDSNINNVEG